MGLAVEVGNLQKEAALAGMTDKGIISMLQGSKDLIVQPAAKNDRNTTMISIQYICEDADLAAAVVNAIVDGYSEYLKVEYQSAGNEIYDLLTNAENRLAKTYEDLAQRSDDFRDKEQGIIWTGDQASDPHALNYARTKPSCQNLD